MRDEVQGCMTRLKELAAAPNNDPRPAAADIARTFCATANKPDRERLKRALDDARLIGLNTSVPAPFFAEHSRWLSAVESARAAI